MSFFFLAACSYRCCMECLCFKSTLGAFLPSNAHTVSAFSTSPCFPHDLRRAVCASSFWISPLLKIINSALWGLCLLKSTACVESPLKIVFSEWVWKLHPKLKLRDCLPISPFLLLLCWICNVMLHPSSSMGLGGGHKISGVEESACVVTPRAICRWDVAINWFFEEPECLDFSMMCGCWMMH